MSFVLNCPNCGPREVYEYRYGGQVLDSTIPAGTPLRTQNLPERQEELWYHRLGCRRWLRVERDVRTNAVVAVGWLGAREGT